MEKVSPYNGIIVVNKPSGMTSHDVVAVVRRKLKMRRVGHAGTLDPLATGLLIILLGKATKLFSKFEAYNKAYRATMILGRRTTTADIEGELIEEKPFDQVTRERVEGIMRDFCGQTMQIPPMVSAVKVKGKKLYELARQGIEIEREPRKIHIYRLELLTFAPPRVSFSLECSKGTYVRKLAEDMAERLDTVACIAEIERTQVGPFQIDQAVRLDDVNSGHVQDWPGPG